MLNEYRQKDGAAAIEPEAVRIEEAARLSGLGRTTIYNMIRNGELPAIRIGKRRLVRVAAIRELLARLETRRSAA